MTDVWFTIGPQAVHVGSKALVRAGARGARLTFSFGTPNVQLERAREVRAAATETGLTCLTIADLEGGKARLGEVKAGADGARQYVEARVGEVIPLIYSTRIVLRENEPDVLPLADRAMFEQLRVGSTLVLGDGSVQLELIDQKANVFSALVVRGGRAESRRGVFLHGAQVEPISITEKDKKDLSHIAAHDEYDAVAVSFVSGASDIELARTLMDASGKVKPVIAKIETAQGVTNVRSIAQAADMVMIARGDLALTMPWVDLPQACDEIASACSSEGTPWILATQIAEGLEGNALMTRAEICDLWQWALRSPHAVMLSRETAWGPRPVDAVAYTQAILSRYSKA